MPWDESQYIIDETLKLTAGGKPTGIPPTNLGDNAKVTASNAKARIVCTTPPNTVLDGKTVCSVKGMMIVRKQGSAPVDQNDGTLIADIAAGEAFDREDTGLTNGVEYYYGFFPYSYQNVFNINPANIRVATPQAYKIWAFDQNFSDLNPATTITYPEGFENSNFSPMHTNKDTGTVTAGGWLPFLQETLKNYPYMVKTPEAVVDYALDPTDYSKKASDGSASDYDKTSTYDGGCFAWINKIYMKEDYASDGNSRRVQFCDGPMDGFIPVGFYDFDQNELEGVWIPMCGVTGLSNGKAIFAPGNPIKKSTNIGAFKTDFEEDNGSRAVFFAGPIMNVLRDLMWMMFKTTYIRDVAGHGTRQYSSTAENNPIKPGPIKGWYGTNAATKSVNLMFHSTVFTHYGFYWADPYYLTLKGGDKSAVSPFYVYHNLASGYVDVDPTGVGIASEHPTKLKKGPDYWGSMVDLTSSGGSSTTGFTTQSKIPNSLDARYSFHLLRLGWQTDYGPSVESFAYSVANMDNTPYTAAPMLLPNPGYSPFN